MRVSQGSSPEVQNTQASKKSDRASKADAKKGAEQSSAKAAVARGDAEANISAKARDFAKAKSVAADAPDVREQKIAELKRRIAAGTYKVDADAVADRMVDDHLKSGIG